MYVRFTISKKDRQSHLEQGLLRAAGALQAAKQFTPADEALLREVFDWFNRSLPRPTRVARSSRPNAAAKAVSWFKDTAGEVIARMEELAAVLREHGYVVRRVTTNRPAYAVYEQAY